MPIRTRFLIAAVAVRCTIVAIARATSIIVAEADFGLAELPIDTILSSGTVNDEINSS